MAEISVNLRSIPNTGASMGWAGSHTVTIDRPEGRAGGSGLGFNGGEMLGLAIGGCFCNDLHYVAAKIGAEIREIEIVVKLTLAGEPLLVTGAALSVRVEADGDVDALVARAAIDSTVSNSIARGVPVTVMRA